MGNRTCSIAGCERAHLARGLCVTHYNRARRDGAVRPLPKLTADERFWSHVDKTETCWNWTGAISVPDGYGRFNVKRRATLTHRLSWEMSYGPIPDGMMIDHRCFNRACVRPDHLRPVTNAQNMQHRPGPMARSTSGHRGVSWHKATRKWRVHASAYGKAYYGGLFSDINDAVAAAQALRDRVMTHHIS